MKGKPAQDFSGKSERIRHRKRHPSGSIPEPSVPSFSKDGMGSPDCYDASRSGMPEERRSRLTPAKRTLEKRPGAATSREKDSLVPDLFCRT